METTIQKQLKPKFKVGDKVSHKPNLYKETSGKITEVSRMYKACDKDRNIDYDGLSYVETHHDWPSWATQGTKPWVSSGNKDITYNRVDEYLIKGVWTNGFRPDFYMVWTSFTYCVTSPKMNTVFGERSLKLIKDEKPKVKATTKVGLNLCKHAHENRFLMCWYVLTIEGKKLNFRASEFVPKNVDKQLSELHCTIYGPKLLDGVKKLLTPYVNDICKQALEFLALPKEKQLELAESEDKFENPLYINYR